MAHPYKSVHFESGEEALATYINHYNNIYKEANYSKDTMNFQGRLAGLLINNKNDVHALQNVLKPLSDFINRPTLERYTFDPPPENATTWPLQSFSNSMWDRV